ncbi:MAG TPA: hypothetical protein VF622_07985 [Segetibacter sp.]|jgi:hypothetical protein
MQIKKIFSFVVFSFLSSTILFAQSDADKIEVRVGGTFGKPKIMPSLSKLAIAQYAVNYKLTTTESVIGKEKSSGSIAGAKLTAFLEPTDGELTQEDLQEVTDYGYNYFQKQLQANGVATVDWSTISGHEFYNTSKEKDDDKNKKGGNVWLTSNANNGNMFYDGGFGFGMGKANKAAKFSKDIDAPLAFFNLVVDFADILLNVDIKTARGGNYVMAGHPIKKTKSFKYEGTVTPDMNVTPSGMGTLSFLFNEKMHGESIMVKEPIFAGYKYSTAVAEDESRIKNKAFAFAKSMKPVIIETTKAQYKEGAKKALEKHADAFIAKAKSMKKG